MNSRLKNKNILIFSTLLLSVILGVFVFLYPVFKPVPPGVDSVVYINDIHWIIDNKTLPKPGQFTYHGSSAYPAPMTDLNISLLNLLTGLDVVFPLFSVYQIFLIVLIILSSYLVGKIYGSLTAILLPIAVLSSFSLIRLFIGSTVSNLLAFVYMNFIYYLSYRYYMTKKFLNIVLIALVLISLFLTHNYLSAPIFISTFVLYVVILLIIDKSLRAHVRSSILSVNKYLRYISYIIIGALFIYLIIIYIPVFKEAKYSFWQNDMINKFLGPISPSQFSTYLGPLIYTFAVLGILFYLLYFKKNITSFLLLPFLYTIVLLVLLQTSRLGINFFYERLVFLAAIVVALFATYFFTHIATPYVGLRYAMIVTALFIVLVVTSGVNQVKSLYDSSNKVTTSQIEALELLKSVTSFDDIIFSNINAVSETYHDSIIADRYIAYFPTSLNKCVNREIRCLSLNSPGKDESKEYFKEHDIKFFLFMKNSQEGNSLLDKLIMKFRLAGYAELYSEKDAFLFELN